MGAIRPIVPILISAGGVSMPVYALLDSGANRTALLTSLAFEIGAEIKERSCKVSTFGRSLVTPCEFTDFVVQPLDKSFTLSIRDAVVGDILTTESDRPLTNKDIEGYPYLKDVILQDLENKTIGVIRQKEGIFVYYNLYYICSSNYSKQKYPLFCLMRKLRAGWTDHTFIDCLN